MVDDNTPIDYRYLNLDTQEFVSNLESLLEQFGSGATLRTFMHVPSGQILYAASASSFEECLVRLVCRRIEKRNE